MPIWQPLHHSRLRRALARVPGGHFDEERWFGERGAGTDLTLVDTVQFGRNGAAQFLTLNLFEPGSQPGYFYYIPLLVSEVSLPAYGDPLFQADRFFCYDAVGTLEYIQLLDELTGSGTEFETGKGRFRFHAYTGYRTPAFTEFDRSSNSLLLVDWRYFLKNFRRIFPGTNPELRIGLALSAFKSDEVPGVLGTVGYAAEAEYTLVMIQQYIPNQGSGWDLWGGLLTQEGSGIEERLVRQAYQLGGTIARLHHSLARWAREEETYQPFTVADLSGRLETLLETLERNQAELLGDKTAPAKAKLGKLIAGLNPEAMGGKFRIHGDLHLEQVLKTESGWKVIDFEGEPLKTIAEREQYDSPLKDMASMLRSLSYRVHSIGNNAMLTLREGLLVSGLVRGYLESYLELQPPFLPGDENLHPLMTFFQIERAVYECEYELAYRPDWLFIPLNGLKKLLESIGD